MPKKKINPRNRPATEADVNRAKKSATTSALVMCEAIFLTVLVDKFGFEQNIYNVWKEVNKLSEEIKEGRINLSDLTNVLDEEYGIEITKDLRGW